MNLALCRERVGRHCETLLDPGGPPGCYRSGRGQRPDLYSSVDVALMRTIMGENLLETLAEDERAGWCNHLNSFVNHNFGEPTDGTYFDSLGHSVFHANGQVVGALGVLGGKQPFPVRLYEQFDTPAKVENWLDGINWAQQWPSSHLFWGGMVCFSFSAACTPDWVEAVIGWLDTHLDSQTGWWRRGAAHADRNQPLGGGAHIWPIYQHQGRAHPYPDRLIDSILGLQGEDGLWNAAGRNRGDELPHHHYLELDALYGLVLGRQWAPDYRARDIESSAHRYGDLIEKLWRGERIFELHPHWILSFVGALGLLQRLLPDRFCDPAGAAWTDIFSDARLHNTRAVEVFEVTPS